MRHIWTVLHTAKKIQHIISTFDLVEPPRTDFVSGLLLIVLFGLPKSCISVWPDGSGCVMIEVAEAHRNDIIYRNISSTTCVAYWMDKKASNFEWTCCALEESQDDIKLLSLFFVCIEEDVRNNSSFLELRIAVLSVFARRLCRTYKENVIASTPSYVHIYCHCYTTGKIPSAGSLINLSLPQYYMVAEYFMQKNNR